MARIKTLPSYFAGPCPYLPDREWWIQVLGLEESDESSGFYENLINQGWRRNGNRIYQNHCLGCNLCMPLRFSTSLVPQSKSHRRLGKKNRDLTVTLSDPRVEDEFIDLYTRYTVERHGGAVEEKGDFESFFCVSGVDSRFMEYRTPQGRLIGLGLVDFLPHSISSVYFVFDPRESVRGLGIFSFFIEAAIGLAEGKDSIHAGFWVPGSSKMDYKASIFPHEVLGPGGWLLRTGPQDPVPLPIPRPQFRNERG